MFTHGHLDMETPFHLHVLNVRPHSRVAAKVGAPDKVPRHPSHSRHPVWTKQLLPRAVPGGLALAEVTGPQAPALALTPGVGSLQRIFP